MSNKTMEISCYVMGAGAFGVFFRWLQNQIAFDDAGLVNKSVFNYLVPVFIIAIALLYLRFIDKMKNNRFLLPEDFCGALKNEGKLFTIARWAIGGLMCAGSLYLLISCETDKLVGFYQVLSVLGILTGLSFPLALTAANKPNALSYTFICTLSVIPILFFCMWLLTAYKVNSINSVVWEYAIEILTVIVCITAFFRIGGFAFSAPNAWRCMFFCMLGASLCIVCMADERYMGMQIMLMSSALMLVLYNWIMLSNLTQKEEPKKDYPDDGFDRL